MGHFRKRPDSEGRPGIDYAKLAKERRLGRDQTKAPQELRIIDIRRRLNELEHQIRQQRDPVKREPLYLKYANLAASCLPEVFTPDEIHSVERYSMLADAGVLRDAEHCSFRGSRPDFLPLHHLMKLLDKEVYGGRRAYRHMPSSIILDQIQEGKARSPHADSNDRFIYLLGVSSSSIPAEPDVRNLRGLEFALLTFSGRLSYGKSLQLVVVQDGRGRQIEVGYHSERSYSDRAQIVQHVRGVLNRAGISSSPHYELRKILSGNERVHEKLHVIGEVRKYEGDKGVNSVAISYLSTQPSVKV